MSNSKRGRNGFSLSVEDISDTELNDNSFTFCSGTVAFNPRQSTSKSTSKSSCSEQGCGITPENDIKASDNSKGETSELDDTVIGEKSHLNETIVKYLPETDSILFAKTPPRGPTAVPLTSAKRKRKSRSTSPSLTNMSKRMKTDVTSNSSAVTPSSSRTAYREMTQNSSKTGKISPIMHVRSPITGIGRNNNSSRGLIANNVYNFGPCSRRIRGTLRPIVIDGSNVAMAHGNNSRFSCLGIRYCARYFSGRGHEKIIAFVPQYRHKRSESTDTYILDELQREGILKFTPSREVGKKRFVPYDDRYILQYAHDTGAIIVSNDNYRDLYDENPLWRDTIRNRVLSFTWIDETYIMFPQDPLGRNGPTLDQFLRF